MVSSYYCNTILSVCLSMFTSFLPRVERITCVCSLFPEAILPNILTTGIIISGVLSLHIDTDSDGKRYQRCVCKYICSTHPQNTPTHSTDAQYLKLLCNGSDSLAVVADS